MRTWGEPPTLDFAPRPHWELGAALGLLDLPAGAKVTGSGFPLFTGMGPSWGGRWPSFMLDLHTREHGYLEVAPPYLVNRATLTGHRSAAQVRRGGLRVPADDLFLIPTAEVPVTNIHRDEILEAAALPAAMCAYTPCFRREAGSAGKDTRGLIRVHQFDKVELVRIVPPGGVGRGARADHRPRRDGAAAPGAALPRGGARGGRHRLRQRPHLRHRGLGRRRRQPGSRCPSSSTFTDFQARRANIRYRPAPKAKPEFVHTLNASGVAFPRTIIALLENNQAADGSVRVPEALVPYLGADRLVPRA